MYNSYSFTTSELDGVSCQRQALASLYHPEKEPSVPTGQDTGMGPIAGLDTEVRGKILCFCRASNLDRPVVRPVDCRLVVVMG
jgi:hypothetical protein